MFHFSFNVFLTTVLFVSVDLSEWDAGEEPDSFLEYGHIQTKI